MTTPASTKPNISFFCPAYYDEKNIETVVHKALRVLSEHANEYEILIVEDGSPDNTAQVADELAARHERVRVIHHPRNKGYGAALQTGFKHANMYEYVCFTDGDNQFDFNEIVKMIPLLDDYDVVISYRITKPYGIVRKAISKVYNLMVRFLFKMPFRDVNSSLKIFKREVIDSISIESVSPFVDPEILVKAQRLGYRINEVGILSYPRLYGRASSVKPKNILATLRDMFRLWWRLQTGQGIGRGPLPAPPLRTEKQ
jgi:glycosyltransferase involved in cell wall biosynthesis